jgi:hypothetical protein
MTIGYFPPNDNTAVSVLPTPKASGSPGYFTDGNLTLAATNADCDWYNGVDAEFRNLSTAGGVALNKGSPTAVQNILNLITNAGSLYVKIAGSTMTGNLITGYNYGATSGTSALVVENGTYGINFVPRVGVAALNPITQANDSLIWFSTGSVNTGGLVIGPNATGTSGGLRIDSIGNVTASENLNTQTALFLQNGTSNRWGLSYVGSESGSNAGSNLQLVSYADAGTSLGVPLSVVRSTGVVSFSASPTIPTQALSDNTTSAVNSAWVKGQAYAPLASPALTGTPTAPTATAGTANTQIASTGFVANSYAPLASPALTGVPTCPTGPWTWDARLANQAWVGAYFAPLASPGFTGAPTTPTPAAYDISTHIPNTTWIWANLTNFATNGGGNYTATGNGSCITFPSWITNSTPIKLQFGQNAFYGSSGSYQYQYFPVTFPNSVIAVFATIGWNSGGSVIGGQTANNSCMTIGWALGGSSAYAAGESYSWFAVGY